MSIILPRRGFILGLGSLIAAPAVVRASSLMPIHGDDPFFEKRLPYIYRASDGRVSHREEIQFLRRSEFEIAAPRSREPGAYYWSSLGTGGLGEHRVLKSGFLATDQHVASVFGMGEF